MDRDNFNMKDLFSRKKGKKKREKKKRERGGEEGKGYI
jgi:hypothetical protein